MIPVNELRIGNWVQGDPLSIPTLTMRHNGMLRITGYGIMLIEGGQLQVSPIPLSTEILEAAGFERMAGFHQIDLSGENGIKWVGTLLDNETLSVGDAHDDAVSMRAPQYLHTLQNLFFALTGQELTVSPL